MNDSPSSSPIHAGVEAAQETVFKIWMGQRLKGSAIGAGCVILGVVILVIYKLSGAGAEFFQESHNVAEDALHGARGGPAVMAAMLGMFIGFIGAVVILVHVVKVLLGPPKAGKKPNRTIDRFYKSALGEIDLPFVHGLGGIIDVAAFACLLNSAKQEIGGWTGFVKYWKRINNDLKSVLKSNSLNAAHAQTTRRVKSIRTGPEIEGRASYEVDIAFSVNSKESSSGKMKRLGPYLYTAKGETVRVGNRWYLSSGRWNGAISAA